MKSIFSMFEIEKSIILQNEKTWMSIKMPLAKVLNSRINSRIFNVRCIIDILSQI